MHTNSHESNSDTGTRIMHPTQMHYTQASKNMPVIRISHIRVHADCTTTDNCIYAEQNTPLNPSTWLRAIIVRRSSGRAARNYSTEQRWFLRFPQLARLSSSTLQFTDRNNAELLEKWKNYFAVPALWDFHSSCNSIATKSPEKQVFAW